MTPEKLKKALDTYGPSVIAEVRDMVNLVDADFAYSFFEDEGKEECAECVEFLYFED